MGVDRQVFLGTTLLVAFAGRPVTYRSNTLPLTTVVNRSSAWSSQRMLVYVKRSVDSDLVITTYILTS